MFYLSITLFSHYSLEGNSAEGWIDSDAAESFFQLLENTKGRKGSENPPRETMLICPWHTVVI